MSISVKSLEAELEGALHVKEQEATIAEVHQWLSDGFAKFYSSTTFCSSHGRHTCVADKKKGGCFDGCYPSAEILTTRPTPALSHAHAYSLGMP